MNAYRGVALAVAAIAIITVSSCTESSCPDEGCAEPTTPREAPQASHPSAAAAHLAAEVTRGPSYGWEQTAGRRHTATNPAQAMAVRLELGVLRLQSVADRPWTLTLSLTGYGRGDDLVTPPPAAEAREVSPGRMAFARGAHLLEWYDNIPLGVEQGFELSEPPPSASAAAPRVEELTLALSLTGVAEMRLAPDGSKARLRLADANAHLVSSQLFATDAAGVQLATRFEAGDGQLLLRIDDRSATYPLSVDPLFSVETKVLAPDGAAGDIFGIAAALSGNTAVVGASGDGDMGTYSGSAHVFLRDGALWNHQAKLLASDGTSGDAFGKAVSVSGDVVLVGAQSAIGGGSDTGAAYVFVRSAAAWPQEARLAPSDGDTHDWFGCSVSVSGELALVGADGHNVTITGDGAAYVFARSAGAWTEEAKLTASDPALYDEFGGAVAIDGETAIVGAEDVDGAETDTGAAYVFVRNAKVWTEEAKLTAGDAALGDRLGSSVAVSGDVALLGAIYGDVPGVTGSGAAYVFVRSAGSWTEQAKLGASDAGASDRFGATVALSDGKALVGAAQNNTAYPDAGAAYVFVRDGTSWSELTKLVASDPAPSDRFGTSVAISEDNALVGAHWDDEMASDAGAAYGFVGDQANGEGCSTAGACGSGHCVDGVCCDELCGGGQLDDCIGCAVAVGAPTDGTCAPLADTTPCNDGMHCNGTDSCEAGACAAHTGDPCPGPDGDDDCAESCDELTDECTAPDTDEASCDDSVFCNGADTCQGGQCVIHAGDPCPGADNGNDDCHETCDENQGACVGYDGDGAACLDGRCQQGICAKMDGTPCTAADQCQSEYCLDDVCCESGDCSPYRCGPSGVCLTNCSSSVDCAAGFQCRSDSQCALPDAIAEEDSGCGCRLGARRESDGRSLGLALLAGAWLVRRRPRRRHQ